jgi:predicted nuclease of restriction endonuclease-like RecB superfamily
MLSPEHVRVRRQGRELKLLSLSGELRERASALAALVIGAARAGVGESREELYAEWASINVVPRERRILSGLTKLVEDCSEFEVPDAAQAAEIRSQVFGAAEEARREGRFDRARVLSDVATARGVEVSALETALYADLRGAQRLISCNAPAPEALVDRYERAQVQAILLRAVRVVALVRCKSPERYRALFRKLKFRRLMHRITPLDEGGYRLEIDGPFSLFQSVAKYGLELSLMLPDLESCDELDLVADVRWTERSGMLEFRYRSQGGTTLSEDVRDDVRQFMQSVSESQSGWVAKTAARILDLPGLGVCVPDLVLERVADGAQVFVEFLGFWSRKSVWTRVELAERGLGERVLFVVDAKLRVSEEVLEEDAGASLFVYKTRINAAALLKAAEKLAERPVRARRER